MPATASVEENGRGKSVSITLNDTERALTELLDDACRWIQHTQPQPDPVESGGIQVDYPQGWTLEARIAGGWVRDKLLGFESHDLDISLSSLTGHIFALLLRSYLLSPSFATSRLATDPTSPFHSNSASSNHLVGHITKIAANPEQSKNLETATATVAGLPLDFVNLRKEVYIGDSRIPTMSFGTAQEDAERRDITINTLFYNLHTDRVEDFTGLGLSDMRNKLIRTPLSPQRTFLDDPLRVLRCIRFASRFGYTVHSDIKACFEGKEGEEIREALRCKVSRERFGIEVDQMIRGPRPVEALELIVQMRLFDVIFHPPPGSSLRGEPLSESHSLTAAYILDFLWSEARKSASDSSSLPSWLLAPLLHEESRRLLFYNAALLPLKDMEWEEKKGKWYWAGECVVTNGLKLGVNNTRKPTSEMTKATQVLDEPVEEMFDSSNAEYRGKHIPALGGFPLSPRATMALLIRLPCITNPDIGLNAGLCLTWTAIASISQRVSGPNFDQTQVLNMLQPFLSFYSTLESHRLVDRVEEKALLDGTEVQEILKIKPDKSLQTILKRVEAWQFDQDIQTGDREDKKRACREWLLDEWTKGNIVPESQRGGQSKPKKKVKGS